jgi:hypothetical protein
MDKEHHLIAQARARGQQGSQTTIEGQFISAPNGGNDMLAHRAGLAAVLDDLQIAAWSGLLETEEHGTLIQDTTLSGKN